MARSHVVEGSLSDARTVEVGVIDHSPDASDTASASLEAAIAQLEGATTAVDREPTDGLNVRLP